MERSNNLDIIRFIAAGSVIFGHAFPLNEGVSPGFLSNSVQTIGVKIFFTLSGFLIAQSWASDPHLGRFFARRGLRLFPALAVVLIFSMVVVGWAFTTLPSGEYWSHPRLWRYLGTLSLNITYDLPGVFATNHYPTAVNGSLWSLPVEVVMYLCTPVVLTLGRLVRSRLAVLWVVSVSGVAASAWFVHGTPTPVPGIAYGMALSAVLDVAPYFAIGALAAESKWHLRLDAQTAVVALLVALMFPVRHAVIDEFILCVLVPIVVLGLGFAPSPRFARAGRFGDFSYGLYLYGFVVQQSFAALFGGAMNPIVNALLSLVVALALALASWHLVEKRALALRPRSPRLPQTSQ